MKKIEILIFSLAMTAFILRFFSIEGSVLLISTFFLCAMALFYFLFGFMLFNDISFKAALRRVAYSTVGWKRVLWATLSSITIMITIFGIVFVINKWPGGFFLSKVGITLMLPIIVTSLICHISKSSRYHLGILIRLGFFMIMSFVLLIMNWY